MMDSAESKRRLLLVVETHVRLTWLPRSVIADDVDGPIVLSASSAWSKKNHSVSANLIFLSTPSDRK
jgi:hypothetical protein